MVNQEILGGLISGLSRGQSLQNAMFSMFNAGYKKEEIEEAARILQSQSPVEISEQKVIENKQIEKSKENPKEKKLVPAIVQTISSNTKSSKTKKQNASLVSAYGITVERPIERMDSLSLPPVTVQRVSGYSGRKPKSKFTLVVLSLLIAIVLGVLILLFVLKDKFIEIISQLFS